MSEPSKNVELKAGHPPAVKAGGMRIASKHHPPPHQHQPTPEEKADEEEFVEPQPKDQGKVVISGVVTKGNADFQPEAVKIAHDKPAPQHEKRPPGPAGGRVGGMHIQQPRKS